MAKKNKGYSLEDYIAGISLDEFEKNQAQLKEKKPVEESTNSGSYNLLNEMTRKYNEIFCSDFQTKKYLYYKRLDDLVIKAQAGDETAVCEIIAFALHNWQPNAMRERYHIWNGNTDTDDLTQGICMSVLNAIRTFKFEDNCFKNFAGYLRAWVQGDLKASQINSAPIKIKASQIIKDENGEMIHTDAQNKRMTYVFLDGFADNDEKIDIRDNTDDYAALEDVEADAEFVANIKKWPDRIGEVMITYYGIASPADSQKTLQKTAEVLGLSVKQVRTRLEKGRKIIEELYPQYKDVMAS